MLIELMEIAFFIIFYKFHVLKNIDEERMSHEEIIKFEDSIYQIKLKLLFNVEIWQRVELLKHFHKVFGMSFSIKRVFGHPI